MSFLPSPPGHPRPALRRRRSLPNVLDLKALSQRFEQEKSAEIEAQKKGSLAEFMSSASNCTSPPSRTRRRRPSRIASAIVDREAGANVVTTNSGPLATFLRFAIIGPDAASCASAFTDPLKKRLLVTKELSLDNVSALLGRLEAERPEIYFFSLQKCGPELVRCVRLIRRTRGSTGHAAVVILTNDVDSDHLLDALQHPCVMVMPSPFTERSLQIAVTAANRWRKNPIRSLHLGSRFSPSPGQQSRRLSKSKSEVLELKAQRALLLHSFAVVVLAQTQRVAQRNSSTALVQLVVCHVHRLASTVSDLVASQAMVQDLQHELDEAKSLLSTLAGESCTSKMHPGNGLVIHRKVRSSSHGSSESDESARCVFKGKVERSNGPLVSKLGISMPLNVPSD